MCLALERQGHTVELAIAGDEADLVTLFDRKYIRIPLVKKKFLRIISFWLFGGIQFWRSFRRIRPDLVITDIYTVWFSLPFVLWPWRNTRVILDNRTPFYEEAGESSGSFASWLMKLYTTLAFAYSRAALDGITVITDHYKDLVTARFRLDPSRVGVWGSGVDLDKLDPAKHQDPAKLDCMKGKFSILQHGDMTFNRGLVETIEAFRLIENADIVLVLVGDGPAKKHLVETVRSANLGAKVFLFDPMPNTEIPNLIAAADCAIMAYPDIEYWNNNNPLKLLEYLAMEKVVICTDMWTFRSVCGSSPSAHYIKTNTPENIAAAIEACYADRNELRQRGRGGPAVVGDRFSWDAQAKRLTAFAESLPR
jgi:glycosyltransferase involved in cell wall biosynthesis